MTEQEKAAVLMLSLPPDKAESILARIGPERGGRLRTQMQRMKNVPRPPEVMSEILREFDMLLRQLTAPSAKEPAETEEPEEDREQEETEEAATTAPATPTATPKPEPPPKPEPSPVEEEFTSDPIAGLKQVNVDRLTLALMGEQPRAIALILNYLDIDRAGEVLRRLTPEVRRTVSLQLGKPAPVNIVLVQRIARAILQKTRSLEEAPAEPGPKARFKKMADMLRQLDKPDRMEVLTALEEHDSEVAAGVKDLLYQFEDLMLIESRSMQRLLSEVDSKTLATALKTASDPIKDKVLSNLSKRARETLNEEMEFLGTVPTPQVQAAQKSIVDLIQRLDQAGELVMTE